MHSQQESYQSRHFAHAEIKKSIAWPETPAYCTYTLYLAFYGHQIPVHAKLNTSAICAVGQGTHLQNRQKLEIV